MPHKTEIINTEKIHSNLYAVDIRCCGVHLFRHSMSAEVRISPDKLALSLQEAHRLAAADHENSVREEKDFQSFIGHTVEHP